MPEAISLFRYFGGKNRQVKEGIFTDPKHKVIIEPFAGSAAYAIWYSCQCNEIILNELDTAVYEIYKLIFERADDFASYEIPSTEEQYLEIKDVGYANWLSSYFTFSGFKIGNGKFPPADTICYQSRFCKPQMEYIKYKSGGYSVKRIGYNFIGKYKDRIIAMAKVIKENCTITLLNQDGAQLIKDNRDKLWTWFIDPPYSNKNGDMYNIPNTLNFSELAKDIISLEGHSITTEQDGANWLDFKNVASIRSSAITGNTSKRHDLVVYEQG